MEIFLNNCNVIAFYTGLLGFIISSLVFIAQHFMRNGSKQNKETTMAGAVNNSSKIKNLKFDFPFICLLIIFSMAVMASPVIVRTYWQIDVCGNPIEMDQLKILNKILGLNTTILEKVNNISDSNQNRGLDIDGDYFYRSSVNRVEDGMLFDEKGNSAYMLIGDLTIRNNQISAHRHFAVRARDDDKMIEVEKANVDWNTNHMFSFLGDKDMVIYKLASELGDNPSNEGFFIGRSYSYEKDDNNRAKKIEGKMHYMMRKSKSWIIADKVLVRKDSDSSSNTNPYINHDEIRKWFRRVYGKEVVVKKN